jgi:hypothetical protein
MKSQRQPARPYTPFKFRYAALHISNAAREELKLTLVGIRKTSIPASFP